ncbi:MAG: peptidase S53, partial [Candidatus Eremiobacteraeota bacterium]|nr:peptidase S53 [Candidatus Eremiobacteraeota bacterium]
MAEQRVPVPGSERDAPSGATPAGPATPDEPVEVTVRVRPAAPPPEPGTHAPLSREEFSRRYGARAEDAAAVEAFASQAGLTVAEVDLARRSVVLRGSCKAMASAFGATLQRYERDGTTFRARTGPLTIPAHLDGIVQGVFGLDNRPQARAHFRAVRQPRAPGTSFTVPQLAKLYAFPTDATGAGQTIALIELGGGFTQQDLTTYFGGIGVTPPKVISVGVDGATNAPAGDPNSADGEVLLDIEVAGALAPAASIV